VHARPSFPALGDAAELAAAGMRVSVDTFDPDEIAPPWRLERSSCERERLDIDGRHAILRDGRARGGSARPWQLARNAGAEP